MAREQATDTASAGIEPQAPLMGTGAGAEPSVRSLERAILILKAVAASPHPCNVAELAQICELNRTTTWRLLGTLAQHGLVERDQTDQRYRVGHAAYLIARSAGHDAVVRRVHPILERLAAETGEISALVVAVGNKLMYADQADPPGMQCPSWLGRVIPAHADSPGKAYVAWMPRDEREALLGPHLERLTPNTVTDRNVLDRQLEQARRDGFAVGIGEHVEFTNGVSAPVLDPLGRPVAAIQVWGPSQRMAMARLRELSSVVVAAAREAEAVLR